MSFQRALVSVSDKSDLETFLRPFYDKGMEIVSTKTTGEFLKQKGFKVTFVEDVTGFSEALGGRIKTLHPKLYMGLLSRPHHKEDEVFLKEHEVEAFDLVVVNLYPFETMSEKGCDEKTLVESIDVGGPSMLRAAAKNYERITVVCDPKDYDSVTEKPSLEERKKLSSKVFQTLSSYDELIGQVFSSPAQLKVGRLKELRSLRYGENPHQKATWFTNSPKGLHQAKRLQGKKLSYNNLLDLDSGVRVLREFQEKPCCVAIKHLNPCGVAVGESLKEATEKCLKADPVSAFGGVVALNREVSLEVSRQLTDLFLECVIAPGFSKEAQEWLSQKKRRLVLSWDEMTVLEESSVLFRSVQGGALVQTPPGLLSWSEEFEFVGECETMALKESVREDMLMALKVCAHLKSNAIALVSEGQTLGLGMGQVNRVDAVRQAFLRKKQFHPERSSPVVLASDGFFPFTDSLEEALKEGVVHIIQPGGSLKDPEIKSFVREHKMSMVLTKRRYFQH